MPSYRGNIGNLLQHWVLCEILATAAHYCERVNFIDAYAMAPFASERMIEDTTAHIFNHVRDQHPGMKSTYELAWHKLVQYKKGYPNSASFLTVVWPHNYSLLLCESDAVTVQELNIWASELVRSPLCVDVKVFQGDWRKEFSIESFSQADGLHYFSFDPDMFDRHGNGRNPRNMDPTDLELLINALELLHGRVLVQLSTYSANNDNAQKAVIEAIISGLESSRLELMAIVKTNGQMMSLVFGRDIEFGPTIREMPGRFELWLDYIRKALP